MASSSLLYTRLEHLRRHFEQTRERFHRILWIAQLSYALAIFAGYSCFLPFLFLNCFVEKISFYTYVLNTGTRVKMWSVVAIFFRNFVDWFPIECEGCYLFVFLDHFLVIKLSLNRSDEHICVERKFEIEDFSC